jgi:hypothetical protein
MRRHFYHFLSTCTFVEWLKNKQNPRQSNLVFPDIVSFLHRTFLPLSETPAIVVSKRVPSPLSHSASRPELHYFSADLFGRTYAKRLTPSPMRLRFRLQPCKSGSLGLWHHDQPWQGLRVGRIRMYIFRMSFLWYVDHFLLPQILNAKCYFLYDMRGLERHCFVDPSIRKVQSPCDCHRGCVRVSKRCWLGTCLIHNHSKEQTHLEVAASEGTSQTCHVETEYWKWNMFRDDGILM